MENEKSIFEYYKEKINNVEMSSYQVALLTMRIARDFEDITICFSEFNLLLKQITAKIEKVQHQEFQEARTNCKFNYSAMCSVLKTQYGWDGFIGGDWDISAETKLLRTSNSAGEAAEKFAAILYEKFGNTHFSPRFDGKPNRRIVGPDRPQDIELAKELAELDNELPF